MTAPAVNAPTSSRVGRAWLRSVLRTEVGVGRALPSTATEHMRTYGFAVAEVVGGSPDIDVPFRRPVIGVACWVAPPTADPSIVQTAAAERLAEWVITAAYDHPAVGVTLDLRALGLGSYRPARLHTVIPVSEPREAPDDPSNYARFDIDLLLNWTET